MPMPKHVKKGYDRDRYIAIKAQREAARPPDRISLLTVEERAYIAGIIDGEGTIFVGAVGPERQRTVYPIICVWMTHRGIIEWLAQKLDTGMDRMKRRKAHYRDAYKVRVYGKRAKLLCEVLLPYLRVKDRQARLVTSFPVDARIAPGVKIERSAVNEVRYQLREQINALNH